MRKIGRFFGIFFFAVLSIAGAQTRDFSKVEIKATKVAGTVHMLQGAGGNIGVSAGEDGIVIVDDQFAPLADKIRAALKGISDKPIRFVINTHWHPDHVGGNELFGQASTIIAHENVRKRMVSGGAIGNNGSIRREAPPYAKDALPVLTFKQDSTIHFNGEDIEIIHYRSGHTDGDSIVYFRQSNVVHMGDDFVTYGFPFIDLNSGGSIKGLTQTLEQLLQSLPADVKIIPGHGDLSTPQDVRTFVQMLKDTTAVVEKAIADKKSLDQMKQEKILDRWSKYSGDFINTDAYIESVFNSLTGKKGAGLLKHN